MEGDIHIVDCLAAEPRRCAISGACRLKSVKHEALDAFHGVPDRNTLADLIANPTLCVLPNLEAD